MNRSTIDTAELRAFGARHGNAGRDETSKIIGQAADEIDRLRVLISTLEDDLMEASYREDRRTP